MRAIPIAAVAVMVTFAGAASAGLPTTPDQPRTLAQASPQASVAREPAVNPLTKGDIASVEGTSVYGVDGPDQSADQEDRPARGQRGWRFGDRRPPCCDPGRSVQVGGRQSRFPAHD